MDYKLRFKNINKHNLNNMAETFFEQGIGVFIQVFLFAN